MGIKYIEYAFLIAPDKVLDAESGKSELGCPVSYGLPKPPLFGPGGMNCVSCWKMEVPYKVIAEATSDGYDYKKGDKFEVVGVDLKDMDIPAKVKRENPEKQVIWRSREMNKFYIEKEEDKKVKIKEGDYVRVRGWENMLQDFGLNEDGNIKTKVPFVKGMNRYCGKIIRISKTFEDSEALYSDDVNSYTLTEDMLEPIAEFQKNDLKDGMVVEYRDGSRRLVSGDLLIGEDSYSDLDIFNYKLKARLSVMDIVAVYPGTLEVKNSFKVILGNPGDPIWKRENPVKEISSEEAFRILEEKLGCRVKIRKE